MDLIYQFSALFILILPLAMLIVLLVFINNMNKQTKKRLELEQKRAEQLEAISRRLDHVEKRIGTEEDPAPT
ncbi:hypothetical protein ACFO4L_01395 [Bacillus daqingensis]|uniref:DUF4083 domain-containing protein n=1 Tax=Bacillus daqingensis TaxID=872396 RepID=A0ABV9NSR0_9BACI